MLQDYILMDQVTVKSVDGSALVKDMKLKIEEMLRHKRLAVEVKQTPVLFH